MSAAAPSLIRHLDHSAVKTVLEAHARYLSGRTGGKRANLSYVDLSHMMLDGVDLTEAELTGAWFHGASLKGAVLKRVTMFGCDLREADLRTADLTAADLRGACLRGANLAGANLAGCDLREGRIAMQGSGGGWRILKHERRPGELDYAVLEGANLSGAQMSGAHALAADFTDADLNGACLTGARLVNAVLDGADLSGADLFGSDLSGASLRQAVLVGVNMDDANFSNADLTDVLKAPPPIIYVDDVPLQDLMRDHERYCESGGADGAVMKVSRVDFRSLRQLLKPAEAAAEVRPIDRGVLQRMPAALVHAGERRKKHGNHRQHQPTAR